MCVCYVRPARDLVHAARVLQRDGVSCQSWLLWRFPKSARRLTDVCKFPVFEDQEVVFRAEFLQAVNYGGVEILDHIDMGLYDSMSKVDAGSINTCIDLP